MAADLDDNKPNQATVTPPEQSLDQVRADEPRPARDQRVRHYRPSRRDCHGAPGVGRRTSRAGDARVPRVGTI